VRSTPAVRERRSDGTDGVKEGNVLQALGGLVGGVDVVLGRVRLLSGDTLTTPSGQSVE
jgi:hypothetical protein